VPHSHSTSGAAAGVGSPSAMVWTIGVWAVDRERNCRWRWLGGSLEAALLLGGAMAAVYHTNKSSECWLCAWCSGALCSLLYSNDRYGIMVMMDVGTYE
jgi:hypothetical protein